MNSTGPQRVDDDVVQAAAGRRRRKGTATQGSVVKAHRMSAAAVACIERAARGQGAGSAAEGSGDTVQQAEREHQQPIGELTPGQLGPAQRAADWQRLADERFDVVVIGGGVVGSGAALDAVTRGLKVALVEARDLAAGTSSRSSKLFHGGLRYLEQFEFGLVREALQERELMLNRLAPHLVKPVGFLYPLAHRIWERPYVAAGLALYQSLGGARSVPGQRHLTRSAALQMAPALRRDTLIGGVHYYDAITDDARHTMTVARTAALYGAVVRSSTQVIGFMREADRICGVRVRDCETGEETGVEAHSVLNCTGVWTDEIQRMSGGRGRFRVRPSKGVHIVVPRDRIVSDSGLILRTATSVLFVIPWHNHWIVGTTDTSWSLDLAHPAATRADIDYLLDTVNAVLATPLNCDDIEGVYAGLRPLLAGESEQTSRLSREHAVARVAPGLVATAGGKYTTYRVMAADAVDAAVPDLPGRVASSITDKVPLLGADGYHALVNQADALAARYGLHPYRLRHLLDRYGSAVHDLLTLATDRRDLLAPVPEAPDYLQVEVVHAASHEGALHLEDVLTRRTRISIEYSHRGEACAADVANLMGEVLGWDKAARHREVQIYLARVAAERDSQREPDDSAADARRCAAPEARPRLLEPVS